LTPAQRIADFQYLVQILLGSYPYIEASKRMTGYDWAAHTAEFKAQVESAESDREFAETVAHVLRFLNNEHTGITSGRLISAYMSTLFTMKPWREQAKKTTSERADYWFSVAGRASDQGFPTTPFYAVYVGGRYVVVEAAPEADLRSLVRPGSTVMAVDGVSVDERVRGLLGQTLLRYDPLRKMLYQPVLTAFALQPEPVAANPASETVTVTLRTPDGELMDIKMPRKAGPWNTSYSWPPRYVPDQDSVTSPTGNLYATVLDGGTAYVQIRSMSVDSGDIKSDLKTLRKFMMAHATPAALALDIRGNGGGSDNYWQGLVSMLAPDPVSSVCGVTWRNGMFILPLMQDKRADTLPRVPEADLLRVQAADPHRLPPEILTDAFDEPRAWTRTVEPDNSLNYRGKVFLLVDGFVFSSAESFAAFCKGSRWATIVGSYTGGDGIGYDPAIVALPNSGMVVRFSSGMGLNPDWSANEESHTCPDVLAEWTPEDVLRYAGTSGRPARPDPSWDPQLRACIEKATGR
jgi:hypothetical protein